LKENSQMCHTQLCKFLPARSTRHCW